MKDSRLKRIARRGGRALFWIGAAVVLPVLVGQANVRANLRAAREGAAPPPAAPLPDIALPDASGRRVAVILLGDSLTEATDFLVPYELLSAAGEYDVYAVAHERRPLRLIPGHIDVLPHLSYAEYTARIGKAPALIVVPYLEGDVQAAIDARGDFLRRYWARDNLLLTICGGSYSVAKTGMLAGRRATSHTNVLRIVRKQHPDVQWVEGRRYVDDGNFISSAGITSGLDATLYLLAREHGRETALRVARAVGYQRLQYLDDPAFQLPKTSYVTTLLNAVFVSPRPLGVALYEGASELALAALTDTYPRTFAAALVPLAPMRGYVSTRHGLHLVPRATLADSPTPERLFVLGSPSAEESRAIASWSAERGVRPEPWSSGRGFSYDVALEDLARRQSRAAAVDAARGLEYPVEHLALAGAAFPVGLAARPAGLALAGLLGAWLLRRAWRRRRASAVR